MDGSWIILLFKTVSTAEHKKDFRLTRIESYHCILYNTMCHFAQVVDQTIAVVPLLGTALLLYFTYNAFGYGIRGLPGPFFASISPAWRISLVYRGNAHAEYRKLHEKYGPIVRTAPRVVDISDPAALPIIYGINSHFIKVCVANSMLYATIELTATLVLLLSDS
jgi:hypothetical protein